MSSQYNIGDMVSVLSINKDSLVPVLKDKKIVKGKVCIDGLYHYVCCRDKNCYTNVIYSQNLLCKNVVSDNFYGTKNIMKYLILQINLKVNM